MWQHLGARLSGRALRFLVERGGPAAAAVGPGGCGPAASELTGRERDAVAGAVGAAVRHGPYPERERSGRVITAADAEYPAGFFRLERAPAALWVRGQTGAAGMGRVALVGARRATRGGRAFARELAADLAGLGIEVWSGLARGVDGEAHAGALGRGRTVAVLGCGLDVVYPPEHGRLLEEVCAGGAVLSEFPPGTSPLAAHFPQRNRLLAAGTEALLVVEAGEKSGALTSVNWALALGMPVLVAPGDPRAESCRGSNQLLRAGATPLLDASDVLAALGCAERPGGPGARDVARGSPGAEAAGASGWGGAAEHPLVASLRVQPLHVDELAAVWAGPGRVEAELVRLELEGRIEALGQGFYAALRPTS
jgi:DNA processing protein